MALPKLGESMEAARERSRPQPAYSRAPASNGDLHGYEPASSVVEEESRLQGETVKTTRRRESHMTWSERAKMGGALLFLVGVVFATVELGHRYIAHEDAPWQHENVPQQTK